MPFSPVLPPVTPVFSLAQKPGLGFWQAAADDPDGTRCTTIGKNSSVSYSHQQGFNVPVEPQGESADEM